METSGGVAKSQLFSQTSGNKAVEKQNLEQDPVKCLGDMSVHCES